MNGQPDFTGFWLPLLVPVLLVLAVYRLTRLVVRDTFPPVLWLRDRLAGGWRPLTTPESDLWWAGAPHRADTPGSVDHPKLGTVQIINGAPNRYITRSKRSPYWLAELITCPWCASGWITGCVVGLTDLTVGLPVPWLYGPAVWGAAALLAGQDWA